MDKSTRALPRLSPANGKPILLGFDGVDMSSDAGLILLREIGTIWRVVLRPASPMYAIRPCTPRAALNPRYNLTVVNFPG
ncbi:hypothetical protein [Sedimentitalea sp.]|uniref:hypothetical protein n=1 Tax=Sedimentitalea sp. TaxID=2048915 RepID=UPI003296E6E5